MGKTALIVDDSKTARVVLQQMLETHKLEVHTAGSAEHALTYLSENRPDIIFMDHEMPGMDGFEAVSAIKKNPATATIPIMMYTAQEGELYVGQARALGAVGVLPKQVEPVELSKVLESLRVIGEDAERREHYDETKDDFVTGEYPGLERFDQDLGVLIQELFDQQRAILRRDLRDSHAKIAARVADEIRSPETDGDEIRARWYERHRPGFSQIVIAVVAIFAVVFAWLYWQTEQSGREIQQQNIKLQRALDDQQAVGTQDTFQIREQLAESQQALDSARAVALTTIEWAANQTSEYGFDELPLGDFRLSVIAELANHLATLDFRGRVRIESHVGNYCMSLSGTDGHAPALAELPAHQCDRIGFDPAEAHDLGLRQSVAFANFINLADERDAGKIRYEIISLGNSNPLLDYPATPVGILASEWNDIAASNNRVDISIYPDER
ncbi:MAG: response regulator [Gammaproteobacteria bacterium]|nr:response regulator [Gammaproteobacteria bacterium]